MATERWLHEVGFFGSQDVDLIELVENAGCEFLYGHASLDEPRGRAKSNVETEDALVTSIELALAELTGCESDAFDKYERQCYDAAVSVLRDARAKARNE